MIEHIEPKATANGIAVFCAHDKIVDTDELVGNPRNPNKHPKEQIAALAKIIKRQGWRHPIVVSNRSGFVVKGHGRLLAAKELKAAQVPVDFQDYESEASEYADLMADNKIQEFSELDLKMSADILQDIKDSGDIELEMSAFTEDALNELLAQNQEGEAKEDNPCYKSGRTIAVKGLMLHSVGCAQPSAQVFIKTFNSASYTAACVHGFIDGNSGIVYQTLPWNHRGWHGGSGRNGSCNNTHIGIEMCEPKEIKYTTGGRFTCIDTATTKACVKRTYDSAVELFAYLCRQYGLNPLTDICSHKEGCAKGIATNHGDPEHLWTGLGTGYTMDGFRKAVKNKMDGIEEEGLSMSQYTELKQEIAGVKAAVDKINSKMIYNYVDSNMPDWAKPTVKKMMSKGYLKGDNEGKLGLTDELLRVFVINDRAGVYGD